MIIDIIIINSRQFGFDPRMIFLLIDSDSIETSGSQSAYPTKYVELSCIQRLTLQMEQLQVDIIIMAYSF